MKQMGIFQLVFLGLFTLFIMTGVIVVAIYSKSGTTRASAPTVVVWGSLDQDLMSGIFGQVHKIDPNLFVTYVHVDQSNFEFQLLQAITAGKSPDAILVNNDSFMSDLRMIYPIDYKEYPARDFMNTFIQEGELYLGATSIVAVPISVDPYVMYWNRDLFANESLNTPPIYWDELFYLAGKLTKLDSSGKIIQSAVALGEYQNVTHAKEILSALFLQSDNKISSWDSVKNKLNIVLNSQNNLTPPSSILSFYTQFSDPVKPVYSWNASLTDSKTLFISGRLAMYFGPASELQEIRAKNPNLNFDVAVLPQFKNAPITMTIGNMYGLAMLRTSSHLALRLEIINDLTSPEIIKLLSDRSVLPPVRKDVAVSQSNPYMATFRDSAVISRGWLDPNRMYSGTSLQKMVSSVVSGQSTPEAALRLAAGELQSYAQ